MKRAMTYVAGAAVAGIVAMAATPSHAVVITANGSFGFVPQGTVTVNSLSGDIDGTVTSKFYPSTIVNVPATGNLPNFTGVSLNLTTLPIITETLSPSLVVSATSGGDTISFTFTSQELLALVPTTATVPGGSGDAGRIAVQALGTLSSDTSSTFELGTIARLSQTCTQSAIGGVINCADTLAVGAAAVPEPTSLALLGSALAGFGLYRRRRQTAA